MSGAVGNAGRTYVLVFNSSIDGGRMGTAIAVILLGFAIAAAVVIVVIVRLDRTVRRRYGAPDAASTQESEPRPGEQGR